VRCVWQLGCGHALPGVWAAMRGASVTFQDLNAEVLQHATMATLQVRSLARDARRPCTYSHTHTLLPPVAVVRV
jgi:hypothetical protein